MLRKNSNSAASAAKLEMNFWYGVEIRKANSFKNNFIFTVVQKCKKTLLPGYYLSEAQ